MKKCILVLITIFMLLSCAEPDPNPSYELMVRIDGRKQIGKAFYGFLGVTANHFNDDTKAEPINNSMFADFGMGAELRIGRRKKFGLGAEFGMLIPFYSNQGLDQYDNSGLMVANMYMLLWF